MSLVPRICPHGEPDRHHLHGLLCDKLVTKASTCSNGGELDLPFYGRSAKEFVKCLKTITSPMKNLLKVEPKSNEGSIPNYHFIGNNGKEVCVK